jgi:hypothetical protein
MAAAWRERRDDPLGLEIHVRAEVDALLRVRGC